MDGVSFSLEEVEDLPKVLSAPRFATYLSARDGDRSAALALYHWNLELSSAFHVPLQICEVSVRNSIVRAIEATYGPNWPWEKAFEISLPDPSGSYSPRKDLASRRYLPTSGKIVAELRFVFWEKMLTGRHDNAIWNKHLKLVFPHCNRSLSVQILRGSAYSMLFSIRDLRNRIAHHEPIFERDVEEEYARIHEMIGWTSMVAAGWVDRVERTRLLATRRP